jgi:hypothetical protein
VDQTTRIHGPVHDNSTDVGQKDVWHELARPQIHGYDVVDVNFISPLRFASIADEKVTRIFDAPRNFVAMVNSLGIIKVPLVDVCGTFSCHFDVIINFRILDLPLQMFHLWVSQTKPQIVGTLMFHAQNLNVKV